MMLETTKAEQKQVAMLQLSQFTKHSKAIETGLLQQDSHNIYVGTALRNPAILIVAVLRLVRICVPLLAPF